MNYAVRNSENAIAMCCGLPTSKRVPLKRDGQAFADRYSIYDRKSEMVGKDPHRRDLHGFDLAEGQQVMLVAPHQTTRSAGDRLGKDGLSSEPQITPSLDVNTIRLLGLTLNFPLAVAARETRKLRVLFRR